MNPFPGHTGYVKNHPIPGSLTSLAATLRIEPLPRPLAELRQWLHGLPHQDRQSRAARLLYRLCESPGQQVAWNGVGMEHTLVGDLPRSLTEIGRVQQECLDLLARHPVRGLWVVHACDGPLPGIRLAPGGLLIGYLRELRDPAPSGRPG